MTNLWAASKQQYTVAISRNPAVQWSEAYSTFKACKFEKKKFFLNKTPQKSPLKPNLNQYKQCSNFKHLTFLMLIYAIPVSKPEELLN